MIGALPVLAFAHGGIRQAHHDHALQALADIHLDLHQYAGKHSAIGSRVSSTKYAVR